MGQYDKQYVREPVELEEYFWFLSGLFFLCMYEMYVICLRRINFISSCKLCVVRWIYVIRT